MLKTWRSSSSLDFLQYIKYLIIASGIKLIKGFALHRQFVISLYIGSCVFGTFQALLGDPPRSGGNAFGGIQNALGGLGGNISPSPRLWRGRGQSFFKFRIVDLGRIGLPPRQCECRVVLLDYRPYSASTMLS